MLDYKAKYKELKSKMVEATDLAYRLGMQKGMEQAQQQAQMQQMQQMQQMMMQPQIDPATGQPIQGGTPGMGGPGALPAAGPMDPNATAAAGVDPAMMEAAAAGEGMPDDEMDEHAQGEMDQYIQELEDLVSKGEKPKITDIRASLTKLTSLRKSQKEAKMKQNMPAVVSAQKSLVNNILKKWEKETKVTADNLEEVIKESGLKIE